MIAVGSTVTCRQTGAQLWVVRSAAPNGRWHLVGKRTDTLGRRRFTKRVVGNGDVVEILAAKTYRVGDVVEHHGKQHVVLSDDGDEITLATPETRVPHRGGYTVRVAAGNSTLVSKADLVLATFGQEGSALMVVENLQRSVNERQRVFRASAKDDDRAAAGAMARSRAFTLATPAPGCQ